MRRLFWVCVGAGIAVAVVLRGRLWLRRLTPAGVAEQVEAAGHKAATDINQMWKTFVTAMREKEAELREELELPERS